MVGNVFTNLIVKYLQDKYQETKDDMSESSTVGSRPRKHVECQFCAEPY